MFRIPAHVEYLEIVGRAIYNFAFLEWQIIYVGEKISPGFLNSVEGKTAANIASDFADAVKNARTPVVQDRLFELSTRFADLVKRRNLLIHANPSTAPNGEQRLAHTGYNFWEPEDVTKLALDFQDCAGEARDIFRTLS